MISEKVIEMAVMRVERLPKKVLRDFYSNLSIPIELKEIILSYADGRLNEYITLRELLKLKESVARNYKNNQSA